MNDSLGTVCDADSHSSSEPVHSTNTHSWFRQGLRRYSCVSPLLASLAEYSDRTFGSHNDHIVWNQVATSLCLGNVSQYHQFARRSCFLPSHVSCRQQHCSRCTTHPLHFAFVLNFSATKVTDGGPYATQHTCTNIVPDQQCVPAWWYRRYNRLWWL